MKSPSDTCEAPKELKIGVIGLRGIPAQYSGVEVAVEEVVKRISTKGDRITVYCMAGRYKERMSQYSGATLRYIPTISRKNFEMIFYSILSSIIGSFSRADILHYHALGPSTTAILPRLFGKKVIVTVHGLDWQRAKWSLPARAFLRIGEWASAKIPHATITVSNTLKEYYTKKYRNNVLYIPNGAEIQTDKPLIEAAKRYGLKKNGYLLFVGRLTKEKGLEILVEAFRQLKTNKRLIIVGGSSHTDGYVKKIRQLASSDDRILMTGPIYGSLLAELYSNAYLFVLPSYLEGLPIVLLEALSYGTPILTSDIPENIETIEHEGDSVGWTFKAGNVESLRNELANLIGDPGQLDGFGDRAEKLIRAKYNWDLIAEETRKEYIRLLRK